MSILHENYQSITPRNEWVIAFILIFIILPGIIVAVVSGYGFVIWILQMFYGPPGHGPLEI